MANYLHQDKEYLKKINFDLSTHNKFDMFVNDLLESSSENDINYIYLKKQDYQIAWELQKKNT